MLFYAAVGIVGFLILMGMLVVGDVFGDHDFGGHDTSDLDVGGPSLFSIRTMAAFLTAFGVGGILGRYYGLSHPAASGVGVVAGLVMAGVVYQFAKLLYAQQASSELRMTTLVGRTAEVSVAIPPGGVGQITLNVSGERTEHIARSTVDQPLPRGTVVMITALGGDSVVVAPASSPVPGGTQ